MAKKYKASYLVWQQGLANSEDDAKRLIMTGSVFYPHKSGFLRVDKPGQLFANNMLFSLSTKERFVSRGGYKLLTAIEYFTLNMHGVIALDAGASTGGFTDCLLQHGAKKVYAADVGKNLLHEKLANDPRVINLEGVNLRLAPLDLLPEQVDIIVADVSFISLTMVLEPCLQWLKRDGLIAALIKPQFEVDSKDTIKGIVVDTVKRQQAVNKVLDYAEDFLHLNLIGIIPSAIKGPKGNQEYMAVWRFSG